MKKTPLLTLAVVLVLVVAIIIGGCKATTQTATTTKTTTLSQTSTMTQTATMTQTTTEALTPTYGGILKIIEKAGIVNCGYPGKPWGGSDLSSQRAVVESLLDMDENANVIPWLATEWKIGSDTKSLTLTLRKGVKFHDGTEFTSEAVKTCLEMAKKGRPDLGALTSVDIIDDYTVRLNLTQFVPKFLISMAGVSGRMVSPTALQTMGEECMTHPVGTGPFKFESFQRDVSLKLTRNDDYWAGKPYLDGIEYVVIADPVTEVLSLQSGEAQVMDNVSAKDAADLIATGKYSYNKTPAIVCGIVGDSAHEDSPFADIKIRQAIAYGIDNKQLMEAAGYGLFEPVNQFTAPGHYSYNPQIVGYPYNVQKAKELLNEAGHTNGFSTTLVYSANDPMAGNVFPMIQGYLSKMGIVATLDSADAGRWTELTTKGWNNELLQLTISHSNGLDKADGLMNNLSQKAMFYPSSTVWTPDDYNALLNQVVSETDLSKRPAMFQEILQMITDQYCMAVPLYVSYGICVYTKEVHGFDFSSLAVHLYHPHEWWLSE